MSGGASAKIDSSNPKDSALIKKSIKSCKSFTNFFWFR